MADEERAERSDDGITKKSPTDPQCHVEKEEISEISTDKIAAKLLRHNFILTALEFHAELVESGKELPRLRDYFSNPGNFEKNIHAEDSSPVLPRTSSIQTFDSLDFARYSDDGERQVDERIAVLEFELRKAKDTIKALRTNLTVATELSDANSPTSNLNATTPDAMKPYEKRALNFLVYEYLLQNNYKLSSITFSDENDDQDFEDWDDVGLNVPKPPELLLLYRHHNRVSSKKEMLHKYTETEVMAQTPPICGCKEKFNAEIESYESQINKLNLEKEELVKACEEKTLDLETTMKSLKRELNMLKMADKRATVDTVSLNVNHVANESASSSDSNRTEAQDFVMVNSFSSFDSCDSNKKKDTLSVEKVDTKSQKSESICSSNSDNDLHNTRKVSQDFQKHIQSLCQSQKLTQSSRLVSIVAEITDSKDSVIAMLAHCLPHIVPNILLAKREELIPLILCTIALHPDAKERDKLLNSLFNLIKKPDEDQRHMILMGLIAIAQHLGSSRVEAELLPQCWEQLNHRYVERRLLVVESCGALAPYVPSGIRSSLLFSMLQQMLQEDREDVVREAAIKNLALLLMYVDDSDKFSKALELWHSSLQDGCQNVVETGLNVLLPSLAVWALEINKLESQLLPSIMKKLEEKLKRLNKKLLSGGSSQEEEKQCALFVRASYILSHFLLLSSLKSLPTNENESKIYLSPPNFNVGRFPIYTSVLWDLGVIVGDESQLFKLVDAFDQYLNKEWYKPWQEFQWVTHNFLVWFIELVNMVRPQCQSLIHGLTELMNQLCHLFGRLFMTQKVEPLFQLLFKVTEEEKASRIFNDASHFIDASLPVYICGVLTTFYQEEDRQKLIDFFEEIFQIVSFFNVPIFSLKSAFIELSINKAYHELLLSVLWNGVVHNSSAVRVTSGRLFEILVGVVSETLLRTRITPALVTLANDPEIAVRIATVPAFGSIIEICSQRDLLEKVHLQFQTFLDDPVYWDQYMLHVEVIKTFAKLGPNADPKFRDEFILPRLAALAAQNNNALNEVRKTEVGLALLEAYMAMSCCFMSDQLIAEAFLPGMRCLRQAVGPEQEDLVNNTILEFESKLDVNRSIERSASSSATSPSSIEDMRNRVTKIFTSRPMPTKANIPNLFRRKSGM